MVSVIRPPLTRIGFRRDVRLFLSVLLGFFCILIFALVFVLRASIVQMEETIDRNEAIVAEIAAGDVSRGVTPSSLESDLVFVRQRFHVTSIEIIQRNGQRLISGPPFGDFDKVTRSTPLGTLVLRFDATQRRALRRRFALTSTICVTAAVVGMVLLLLYLPRILHPVEEMLDQAKELGDRGDQEESAYLIDTFRHSITTLRKQEDELKRLHEIEKTRADDLERVTAALTRSLTSGLIAVDAAGLVVDVNAAGREILGLDPSSVLAGVAFNEIVPLRAFVAALERAAEQQEPMTRVVIEDVFPSTKRPVTIGLTTVPLHNAIGGFLGFLALYTDLTPIRVLEERVQEMQTLAQLGEISAGIAHEFRTSMTTILGYLKLARRSGVEPQAENCLQNAEKEASLMLQAIERLVAFARPEDLNSEPVDLRELSEEQVTLLSGVSTDVEIKVRGTSAIVDGDRVLLGRALENLLSNAVDAVRQKGPAGSVEVIVAAEPRPSITIVDNGIGFDPVETSRLFLPFQSNKPNGFGMGLPLAKKIVLIHGGTLHLQGTPGLGAVATMEFPHDRIL